MLSGPDEVVGFIVISYIALIANEASRHSVRDRPVSLICLVSIACSVFYAAGGLMTYWVYVAVLNCALAMQILVAGGMIDFLARRFDDWLCRVWPWGSRAVRFLAA